MAAFPLAISRNGNSTIVERCMSNTVPRFGICPRMSWIAHVTARTLASRSATQVITLVVGGTASDGTYQLTFSGGGLAAPVVVSSVRDSGETSAQMAAELEAAIQTARATTLAGVVTNETVASATITITCLTKTPAASPVSIAVSFPGSATGTLTYTYTAGMTVASTVEGARLFHDFPENIDRRACVVNVSTAFAGVTAMTLIVGDAADPDALFTSTSVLAAGRTQTVAAAEFMPRFEAAFVPQFSFVAASATPLALQSLTAGAVDIEIFYDPLPPPA
jgi:hypothetical protein